MKSPLKIAVLDLYAGTENQGMRCIREIIEKFSAKVHVATFDVFECRLSKSFPDLDYDVYFSTGGPGSPLGDDTNNWEQDYFNWLDSILKFNLNKPSEERKHVFFICHSFQLACRYFGVATVNKRKSTSFGVFPVHLNNDGEKETVFQGLSNPFYAVDNREYQAVQPDNERLNILGAKVLAIEKERQHVPLERAIMSIRFNNEMIGTQFHPEADKEGMLTYLHGSEKKNMVIQNYGEEKWKSMIDQLNDPDKIEKTNATLLFQFLYSYIKAKSAS
jgi:GMP synthase-like glutamine amidotransferase